MVSCSVRRYVVQADIKPYTEGGFRGSIQTYINNGPCGLGQYASCGGIQSGTRVDVGTSLTVGHRVDADFIPNVIVEVIKEIGNSLPHTSIFPVRGGGKAGGFPGVPPDAVSYTHLRAHET